MQYSNYSNKSLPFQMLMQENSRLKRKLQQLLKTGDNFEATFKNKLEKIKSRSKIARLSDSKDKLNLSNHSKDQEREREKSNNAQVGEGGGDQMQYRNRMIQNGNYLYTGVNQMNRHHKPHLSNLVTQSQKILQPTKKTNIRQNSDFRQQAKTKTLTPDSTANSNPNLNSNPNIELKQPRTLYNSRKKEYLDTNAYYYQMVPRLTNTVYTKQ